MSWGELFIALWVLAIIWYGYVLLRYYSGYRHRRHAPVSASSLSGPWTDKKETPDPPASTPDPHAQVHELLQELKTVFAAAARDHLAKEQALEAIAALLAKYPALPDDIKPSVAQHIAGEFFLQLHISVRPEEITALW